MKSFWRIIILTNSNFEEFKIFDKKVFVKITILTNTKSLVGDVGERFYV